MTEIWLQRTSSGISFLDEESKAWFAQKPIGTEILAKVSQPRNAKFHRKLMSLLRFAFNNIELNTPEYKGQQSEASFERFRDDIVILAGFYKLVVRLNGDVVTEAQSLEYSKCSQELAEQIYSGALDVIAKRFSHLGKTPDELERLTEEWMRYV